VAYQLPLKKLRTLSTMFGGATCTGGVCTGGAMNLNNTLGSGAATGVMSIIDDVI
jgi:hypothetical protein